METWITTSFGGDRLVLVPSVYNHTAGAAASAHIGQDPITKL